MTLVPIRCAVLAAAATAALVCAAPASASPSLSVSQSSGVSPGQTVTVALSGLDGDLGSVAVGQCAAQVSGPGDCNLAGSLLGRADENGTWRSNSGTAITLTGGVGGVDCTAGSGACMIAVTSLNNPSAILATVPLSFG